MKWGGAISVEFKEFGFARVASLTPSFGYSGVFWYLEVPVYWKEI